MTLGTVFQLAHCIREAEFPAYVPGQRLEEWNAHQIATTVDFAPNSRIVTWFVGGLNYQVEHHLFPKVCHVHYPALSRIVQRLAREHGIRYRSHATLAGALVSHFRYLRDLGRPIGSAAVSDVVELPRESAPAAECVSDAAQ
jgi:linoleoyl-CoA desaturase